MSNKDFAKTIIKDVGGSENIISVTHCLTRLRFILKDIKSADTVHLREVRGVLGVLMSGDYYMVVIGSEVKRIYYEIREILYGTEGKLHKPARQNNEHTSISFFVYIVAISGIASALLNLISVWSIININGDVIKTLDIFSGLGLYLLPLIFIKILDAGYDKNILPEKTIIYAPVKGKVIKLSSHPDKAFAESIYGDGSVIIPESNLIVSPISGKVTSITPTGNAVTILSDTGIEMLIHTGCDVELSGDIFKVFTAAGSNVKTGDPLIEFKKNALEIEGIKLVCAIIITNSEKYNSINPIVTVAQEQQPFMELW